MTNLASAFRRVVMFAHVTLLKNSPPNSPQFSSTNDGEHQTFAKTGSVEWQKQHSWVFSAKLSCAWSVSGGAHAEKEKTDTVGKKHRRLCKNGNRGNGKRNLHFKCPLFKCKYIKCPIKWDWDRNFCPLNRGSPYSEVSLYSKIFPTKKTRNTVINSSWEFLPTDRNIEFVRTALYIIYKFL